MDETNASLKSGTTDNKNLKGIISLYVIGFFFLMFFLTQALIAYIMNSYPQYTPNQVMLIITLPNLIGLFISFAVGPLTMKIPKNYMVLAIPVCIFIYMMIFYFVGTYNGPFWMLIVAAAIASIPQGSVAVLGPALMADYTTPEVRGKYLSIMLALQALGSTVVFLLGGNIASGNDGADWPKAYLLGLLIIPAVIIYLIMMPKNTVVKQKAGNQGENKKSDNGFSAIRQVPGVIIAMALCQLVFYFAVSAYNQNISIFIIREHNLGTSVEVGLASSIIRIMGVLNGFLYPYARKVLKNWTVPVSYFFLGVGLMITVLQPSLQAAYIGAIFCGLFNYIAFTTVYSEVTIVAGDRLGAVALSITQGMTNIGTYLTPYALGGLGSLFGEVNATNKMAAGFVFAMIVAVAAAFIYVKKIPVMKAKGEIPVS